MQLRGQFEVEPRYFSDKNSEIDFVLQYGTEIIPVEVKGGENKSTPSFKKYIAERCPKHTLRFSERGYRQDGDSEETAKEVLSADEILVLVDLGQGEAKAKAFGCDLTYDYVKINGDYRS